MRKPRHRNGEMTKPIVIIQEIRDCGSKEERRACGTMRRVGVPERALVPLQPVEAAPVPLLHHVLLFGLRRRDLPPERVIARTLDRFFQVGCVTVDPPEEGLRVAFSYTPKCGAPNRWWAQKRFVLRMNEWAQFVSNGRFSYDWTSYWWYEKTVINVAWADELRPDIFTRRAPDYRYALISHLI